MVDWVAPLLGAIITSQAVLIWRVGVLQGELGQIKRTLNTRITT